MPTLADMVAIAIILGVIIAGFCGVVSAVTDSAGTKLEMDSFDTFAKDCENTSRDMEMLAAQMTQLRIQIEHDYQVAQTFETKQNAPTTPTLQ